MRKALRWINEGVVLSIQTVTEIEKEIGTEECQQNTRNKIGKKEHRLPRICGSHGDSYFGPIYIGC